MEMLTTTITSRLKAYLHHRSALTYSWRIRRIPCFGASAGVFLYSWHDNARRRNMRSGTSACTEKKARRKEDNQVELHIQLHANMKIGEFTTENIGLIT